MGASAIEPSRGSAYGTIVVVGGGCYGSYYVRQLIRANEAGALSWKRVLVIDGNARCMVATGGLLDASDPVSPRPLLVVSEWTEFFSRYLSAWATDPGSMPTDSIVPSPLMPHLLYEWVRDRARERWPARIVETRPLQSRPATPWESSAPDGTHYVSFATWICPINCIEPELCPHTRSERTWTMPETMRNYVASAVGDGEALEGPLVFHCTHRAYGVGMIPVSAVIDADQFVADAAAARSANVLVATVSHCHGAMNVLSVT